MKKAVLFLAAIIIVVAFYKAQNISVQQHTSAIPAPFADQLFIWGEVTAEDSCRIMSDAPFVFGGMYLTKKGNIIVYSTSQDSDTVSCFWGKYQLTDATITYHFTDEYYFKGKWDAPWIESNPHYLKGQTRKVKPTEVTLLQSTCDSTAFSLAYTNEEIKKSAKKYVDVKPHGRHYFPYNETKNMKFYTWLFKQIPVLADL